MNVLLVDYLACPRCGPAFGLVLVAREVEERRVRTGLLGCPNCRDEFPVEDGFGDLRPPPRSPLIDADGASAQPATPRRAGASSRPATPPCDGSQDIALQIAAGLGVTEGSGVIVVSESHVDATEALARLVPSVEVAALGPAARGTAGVSPMAVSEALPFRTGVARGVALAASDATPSAAEAARILAPDARVLVTGSDACTRATWEKTGLRTWVDQAGTLVLRTR